jgi:nitrite reductase/ring-hydroxylating ferredoxin subunit
MNENVIEKGVPSNPKKSHITVDIASVQDVPNGKMKHVEVDGKEILIANVGGNYYAISDRCGHSNASLSKGRLNGNVVTCPLHGAQFDVITGRKVKDFNLDVPSFDKLPGDFKRYTQYALELVTSIKTHDQEKYELMIESDRIKMRFPTNSN